jgi:hypothetical protein
LSAQLKPSSSTPTTPPRIASRSGSLFSGSTWAEGMFQPLADHLY